VVQGWSSKEIAEYIGVKTSTVKQYLKAHKIDPHLKSYNEKKQLTDEQD